MKDCIGRFMSIAGCDGCEDMLECYTRWRANEKKMSRQAEPTKQEPWYKREGKLVCAIGSTCASCGK